LQYSYQLSAVSKKFIKTGEVLKGDCYFRKTKGETGVLKAGG